MGAFILGQRSVPESACGAILWSCGIPAFMLKIWKIPVGCGTVDRFAMRNPEEWPFLLLPADTHAPYYNLSFIFLQSLFKCSFELLRDHAWCDSSDRTGELLPGAESSPFESGELENMQILFKFPEGEIGNGNYLASLTSAKGCKNYLSTRLPDE